MPFPAASASAQGKCLTTGPLDACKTPSPGGPVPIPYPNIGMCSDGSGSSKVKIKGKDTLRKGDKLSKSMGDNAGTAGGGVKSSKFMGPVVFKDGCGKVKAQGEAVAYQSVMTEHNDGNTMGAHAAPSQTKVTVIGPPGPDAAGGGGGGGAPAPGFFGGIAGVFGPPAGTPEGDAKGLLKCAPGLKQRLKDLKKKGWKIRYGSPAQPNSSWANRTSIPPEIVIAPNAAGNAQWLTALLAHEAGHAANPATVPSLGSGHSPSDRLKPGVSYNTRMTQGQFVDQNLMKHLRDEGEATAANHDAKKEVEQNCPGQTISMLGNNSAQYDAIMNNPWTSRQAKIEQMAGVFRNETVGGSTQTYTQYYSAAYQNFANRWPGLF